MTRHPQIVRLCVGVLLGMLGACAKAPRKEPPLLVIALLDASGSFEALPKAVETLLGIEGQLRPGDRLIVRTLGSVSHTAGEELLDVLIPVAPKVSIYNQQARAAKERATASRDSVNGLIRNTLEKVLHQPRSSRTDVVGGFAAAAEIAGYEAASGSVETVVLVFTDGEDNGPNRNGEETLRLQGINVRFLCHEGRMSLARRDALRQEWTSRVQQWHAQSVAFVPTGETLEIARFRASGGGGTR